MIKMIDKIVNHANLGNNMPPVFAGQLIYLPVKNRCTGSNFTGI